MPNNKTSSSSLFLSKLWIAISVFLLILSTPFISMFLNQNQSEIIPNLLLFTSYRNLTQTAWRQSTKVNTAIKYTPAEIPNINFEDYTFETLREATNNFRHPAVVRGMFKNSIAVKKWIEPAYLNSKLGDYTISTISTAIQGKIQGERFNEKFSTTFNDILNNNESKAYLFFPVQRKWEDQKTHVKLVKEVNDIVESDLDLNLIFTGFGSKTHKTYFGSQFIIGRGSADTVETTGTGWHCAGGSNYFVQVTISIKVIFVIF